MLCSFLSFLNSYKTAYYEMESAFACYQHLGTTAIGMGDALLMPMREATNGPHCVMYGKMLEDHCWDV